MYSYCGHVADLFPGSPFRIGRWRSEFGLGKNWENVITVDSSVYYNAEIQDGRINV